MKPLTINDLYCECKKQIKKGNGDNVIMISSDDEGNNFHYLWYSFTTTKEYVKQTTIDGEYYGSLDIDNNIANENNTIILG